MVNYDPSIFELGLSLAIKGDVRGSANLGALSGPKMFLWLFSLSIMIFCRSMVI